MAAHLFHFLTLLLLIAVSSNDALNYKCPGVINSRQHYKKVHFEPRLIKQNGQRGQSGQNFAKMRFKISYDKSMDKIPPVFKSFMQEIADFWSNVLSVRPFDATMFIKRNCGESGTVFTYSNKSKEYEEHCSGPCAKITTCGDTVVPEDHLKECTYCLKNGTECQTTGRKGKGVKNADMIIYVFSLETRTCSGGGGIAYASFCGSDPYTDRPIVGHVNICPSVANSGRLSKKEFLVPLIKHEMMHALAFNPDLYHLYRDSNGEPLVERDKYGRPTLNFSKGEFGPKVAKTVELEWHVRGDIISSNRTFIVTPNVARETRAHFNCSELEGAELENDGGIGTALAHWEARVYFDDLMKGFLNEVTQMSRIDLALLADTGWYKVNYSFAETMKYGKDLGCDFCMKSCKYWMDKRRSEGKSVEPFCDRTAEKSSNYQCNKTERIYSGCPLYRKKNPVQKKHQYFDKLEGINDDDLHFYSGVNSDQDFCPIPRAGAILSCNENLTSIISKFLSKQFYPQTIIPLEDYGDNSYCFESRTNWTVKEYRDTCSQVTSYVRGENAGCFKFLCLSSLLVIEVANKRYPCFFKGQVLEIHLFGSTGNATHEGTIICPSCEQLCGQTSDFKCMPENSIWASKYPYPRDECIDGDYIRKLIESWDEEGNTSLTVTNDEDDERTAESDTWATIDNLTSNSKASVTLKNSYEESHQVSQAWIFGPSHLLGILFILSVIINY